MSVTRADLITRLRNPAHSTADTQHTILHTGAACADMREAAEKIESDAKVIAALTDAIWEYGEHRKSCRIDSGKECDCGFFDVIKTLKSTNEQTAGESK